MEAITLQDVYREFEEMGIPKDSNAMVHLSQFVKLFNQSIGEIVDIKQKVDKQTERYRSLGWLSDLPPLPKND